MEPRLVVEGITGGLNVEESARAEAVRNTSQSTTEAGRFRLIEQVLEGRAQQLAALEADIRQRQRELHQREVAAATAIKDAEIQARQAALLILEQAHVKAAELVLKALEESGQLGQKAAVDASAIRQAAQDHLAAGIALADLARLPPAPAPSGGQMALKLGETLITKAASVFERLMLQHPEAGARLAEGLAEKVAKEAPTQGGTASPESPGPGKLPSFEEVAQATAALGVTGLADFLAEHGVSSVADLSLSDGARLVERARELSNAGTSAH